MHRTHKRFQEFSQNRLSLDLADRNVAVVDALLCEACGSCAAACPNKAAQQYGSAPRQVLAGLDELLA